MATLEDVMAALTAATQTLDARLTVQFGELQEQIVTLRTRVQTQMGAIQSHCDDLTTQIELVAQTQVMTQQQVQTLQESIPTQSSGNREPQTPPMDRHPLSPIREEIDETAEDEAISDAEDDDNSSYRTTIEPNALQQMLEQFEKDQAPRASSSEAGDLRARGSH